MGAETKLCTAGQSSAHYLIACLLLLGACSSSTGFNFCILGLELTETVIIDDDEADE